MVVLSLLSAFFNPFVRKPVLNEEEVTRKPLLSEEEEEGEEEKEEEQPDNDETEKAFPVSIILTAHDQAAELKRNLPAILQQDYPAGYEVIVVMAKSEDDTEDVLKQLKAEYPHLYVTFIPDSSRYMSRKKLAITLGVKAAKHEWLLLVTAEAHPASDQWLATMTRNCDESKNLVIGYSNYETEESKTYQRFERLQQQYYLLRESQRAVAYRTSGSNLMFRKSQFMKQRGFEGNLKYLRGEYDFIVNKYAEKAMTATELSSPSWMILDAPTPKQWRNEHLFYMETRQHLQRKFSHRLWPFFDTLLLHGSFGLSVLVILAAVAFFAFWGWKSSYLLSAIVLTASACVSLMLNYFLRVYFAGKAIQRFQVQVPSWKVPFYQLSGLWRHIAYKIRYKAADKYDFISHKL